MSSGKSSKVKCKSEANAPSLADFVNELKAIDDIAEIGVQSIEIITDDVLIQKEIKAMKDSTYKFIDPEPAPVRVPDKVVKNANEKMYYTLNLYDRMALVEYLRKEH